MASLNFRAPDQLPKDLGGMASTSISAFAYPKLVEALSLPYRRPRVHDTFQMLAMPDMDVLDALGCDVATVFHGVTNAFEQSNKWQEYEFNGRLAARVRDKKLFARLPDGTITQPKHKLTMPPSSYVFDKVHGGQPLVLSGELPKPNLQELQVDLNDSFPKDEQIKQLVKLCEMARRSTDKAIFFNGPISAGIGIADPGGIAVWPIICITEPNFVQDYHGLMSEFALKVIDAILPAIQPYIDVIMLSADDWGTQNSLIASPKVFQDLYLPYFKLLNDRIHNTAPHVKTFLHSCGAIYDIIDMIIESGFDILNPIQWPAGKESYKQWKDKCRNRIAMWGGGVNSQETLPLGTVDEVINQCRDVTAYLSGDNGYVFCGIHNIMADIPAEKIMAMYQTAE